MDLGAYEIQNDVASYAQGPLTGNSRLPLSTSFLSLIIRGSGMVHGLNNGKDIQKTKQFLSVINEHLSDTVDLNAGNLVAYAACQWHWPYVET